MDAAGIPVAPTVTNLFELYLEVKIPGARPIDVSTLSDAQRDAELEKGFADFRKDYGL